MCFHSFSATKMPPKKAKDVTDEIAEMKKKLLNKLSDGGADLDDYKKRIGMRPPSIARNEGYDNCSSLHPLLLRACTSRSSIGGRNLPSPRQRNSP